MINKTILVCSLFLIISSATANELKPVDCENKIKMYIQAMEMQQKNTGEEQKLAGLTKEQIKKMQKEKGLCPTAQYLAKNM